MIIKEKEIEREREGKPLFRAIVYESDYLSLKWKKENDWVEGREVFRSEDLWDWEQKIYWCFKGGATTLLEQGMGLGGAMTLLEWGMGQIAHTTFRHFLAQSPQVRIA